MHVKVYLLSFYPKSSISDHAVLSPSMPMITHGDPINVIASVKSIKF